ncbi:hypothetical protein [Myroides odoratus]|uniref:hypothetical protein n=1 Tax=Myroides odoratus TaxID=256 RepID=UPI0039B113FF
MTELNQLIDKYHSEKDEDEKAEIINTDFQFLNDKTKWNFLLDLIEQSETYDLVKVNVYKIIEITDFSNLNSIAIKNRILEALKIEIDEMVRQYGFMSLSWSFSSFPDVIDFSINTMENKKEDLDVRHCAFGVLTKSKDFIKIETLRERLLQIKDFEKYVKTFFEQRAKGNR